MKTKFVEIGESINVESLFVVMVNSEEKTKKSKGDSFLGMFVESLSLLKISRTHTSGLSYLSISISFKIYVFKLSVVP